jgi:L-fucose mutarotase
MINGDVIHPEILKVLAGLGHGATIVIADGHFPFSNMGPAHAAHVYLNYAPGLLSVPDILGPLVKMIDIEAVAAPVPDDGSEPPIFPEYRKLLPKGLEIQKLGRFQFYDAVNSPNTGLIIASGEKRTYACILLTIGLRKFS